MATRKAAPAAEEKKTGTALQLIKERLKEKAQQAVETEKSAGSGGGDFISFKSGRIRYKGGEAPDNKISVVVIDHILENQMYAGRYDPDDVQIPVCFAFGRDADELAPHELASDAQHENCKKCPNNKFGTADLGKGKACKNVRRLALILEDDLDDIENAEVVLARIPVTSAGEWSNYVSKLFDATELPPLAFITEISVVPDSKSQFKIQFRKLGEVEDELLEQLIAKAEECQSQLFTPYQPRDDAEDDSASKHSKAHGRAGAKPATPPRRAR